VRLEIFFSPKKKTPVRFRFSPHGEGIRSTSVFFPLSLRRILPGMLDSLRYSRTTFFYGSRHRVRSPPPFPPCELQAYLRRSSASSSFLRRRNRLPCRLSQPATKDDRGSALPRHSSRNRRFSLRAFSNSLLPVLIMIRRSTAFLHAAGPDFSLPPSTFGIYLLVFFANSLCALRICILFFLRVFSLVVFPALKDLHHDVWS